MNGTCLQVRLPKTRSQQSLKETIVQKGIARMSDINEKQICISKLQHTTEHILIYKNDTSKSPTKYFTMTNKNFQKLQKNPKESEGMFYKLSATVFIEIIIKICEHFQRFFVLYFIVGDRDFMWFQILLRIFSITNISNSRGPLVSKTFQQNKQNFTSIELLCLLIKSGYKTSY